MLPTIIVLSLVLAPPWGRTSVVKASPERLVLAFYYTWFDANTWNSGTLPDLPLDRYNSDNREVMVRHVHQAQQAGIDVLVLNWWGKGNRTETNLATLLDVAGQHNFRVAAVFDINSPLMHGAESYAANLSHLTAVHAAHPAYLRVDGRPVVFFYNVARVGISTWRGVRDRVDPERRALWIAEGTDASYLSVFDGHHLYSVTWPNRIPPATTLPRWGDRVRAYAREHNSPKLWVATVMPGYDDRRIRPTVGFARSRDGGAYYRECWQAAIDSRPDWIIVNSFNEWPEGSYIEPSQAYGNTYLELTREWSDRFKGAGFASSPVAPPRPTAAPAPATPTPPAPPPVPCPKQWLLEFLPSRIDCCVPH